jgi:hypothetical protein
MSIHRGFHTSLGVMTSELLSLNLERVVPRVDVPIFLARLPKVTRA